MRNYTSKDVFIGVFDIFLRACEIEGAIEFRELIMNMMHFSRIFQKILLLLYFVFVIILILQGSLQFQNEVSHGVRMDFSFSEAFIDVFTKVCTIAAMATYPWIAAFKVFANTERLVEIAIVLTCGAQIQYLSFPNRTSFIPCTILFSFTNYLCFCIFLVIALTIPSFFY